MTISTQHHYATLTCQPDKASETRELLAQCAERVASKQPENGPVSWCASTTHRFFEVSMTKQEQRMAASAGCAAAS
jgi:hypothetical protein